MLAKVASDINKPNGQYVVDPTRHAVIKFTDSLAVRKVHTIQTYSWCFGVKTGSYSWPILTNDVCVTVQNLLHLVVIFVLLVDCLPASLFFTCLELLSGNIVSWGRSIWKFIDIELFRSQNRYIFNVDLLLLTFTIIFILVFRLEGTLHNSPDICPAFSHQKTF